VVRIGSSSTATKESEPIHVHISAAGKEAKFWMDPVRVAYSDGFRAHELSEIRSIIESKISLITEKWNEHFEGG